MSETEVYERRFRTTVHMNKKPFDSRAAFLEIEHRGPADYKLTPDGDLRVETYPANSDFEVVAALVKAGEFFAVTQEEIEDDESLTFEEASEAELPNVTEEGTF